jgi:outer membrane protein assembly factor BamB
MLADVNADGTEDVVNLITSRDSGAASRRYAAFDGRTGRLLWQTPDQGAEASSLRAAITGGRLLLSSREGQLTAFDAARGEQHWTSALGDRVRSFCVGDKADTVRVVTVDERALSIDVKTGRQTSARGRHCEPVVTDEDAVGHKPRDRSDPRAPRGVASIYCGGVRVMGDENYVIPDQCKAKARIDPEGLEGMSAHALWKHGPGYIVIGSRRPGTPTPVVGYVHGTKLSWRADVPEGNPLDADDGAPDQVTLSGERLVVAYRNRKTQKAAVTAFAVATGERLWHRVLADTTRLARLVASRDTVFLYADSTVSALSASTGEPQFTLGENHP